MQGEHWWNGNWNRKRRDYCWNRCERREFGLKERHWSFTGWPMRRFAWGWHRLGQVSRRQRTQSISGWSARRFGIGRFSSGCSGRSHGRFERPMGQALPEAQISAVELGAPVADFEDADRGGVNPQALHE